jgi:hypothetical protein
VSGKRRRHLRETHNVRVQKWEHFLRGLLQFPEAKHVLRQDLVDGTEFDPVQEFFLEKLPHQVADVLNVQLWDDVGNPIYCRIAKCS